jgi:hypothetical protein
MTQLDHGYDVGDRVTLTTTFVTVDGTPTSPSELYADYRKPGAADTIEVTPVDEGNGVVTVTLPAFDVPGSWLWYISGTAGVIAADQGEIIVTPKATGAFPG